MTHYYLRLGTDEQYTPAYGVQILIPYIQHLKDKVIWCPFDTKESNFVKVFKKEGFNVVYSHIEEGKDFFLYEPDNWDILISNPPFSNKRLFLERALSFNKPFALLLPLTAMNDTIMNQLFRGKEDKFQLLIPEKRMRFYYHETKSERKQPTFKAVYFGYNLFKQQIILSSAKSNGLSLFSCTDS